MPKRFRIYEPLSDAGHEYQPRFQESPERGAPPLSSWNMTAIIQAPDTAAIEYREPKRGDLPLDHLELEGQSFSPRDILRYRHRQANDLRIILLWKSRESAYEPL